LKPSRIDYKTVIKFRHSKLVVILLLIVCTPLSLEALSYHHFPYERFTSVHVLIVNPTEHRIVPIKASGKEVCRETVVTLANRYGAIAAVNGGFWKLNGKPAGALKINHQWFGTPTKPRGAIGWSLVSQKVLIDRILTNDSFAECLPGDQIEVIPASDPPYTTPEEWSELENIVGGTPVLVRQSSLIEDFSPEQTIRSFLVRKHPRTAVGIRSNGDWVFVVVDSCFYGLIGGMAMKQLSQLMLNLGCVEALNLDGGGSSTMVVGGRVMNKACGKIKENGKYVEAVSDAILIF
jgi:exopolysaccharide biosynthesis protein